MRNTKAGEFLAIAYAAKQRGLDDIAKEIFVLATEAPDAPEAFEGDEGGGAEDAPAPPAETPETVKQQLQTALDSGDYEGAKALIEKLATMCPPADAPAPAPEGDPAAPAAPAPTQPPEPATPTASVASRLPPDVLKKTAELVLRLDKKGYKQEAEEVQAAVLRLI